jgi:ribosomal-protein-serine acetyltransferase
MFRARIGQDLDLRLLEERHAAAAFELVNRDRLDLSEWLQWVDATKTEDDTLSFIRSALEQYAANNGFTAGIWSEDRFAGVVGTHKINWLNRKVEIGYWLGRAFRGKGIMTNACRAVVTYALGELDLHRVEIHCAAGNEKSCAIPRRLRFTLDGTMREGHLLQGQYHDLLVFGMLQRDWKP